MTKVLDGDGIRRVQLAGNDFVARCENRSDGAFDVGVGSEGVRLRTEVRSGQEAKSKQKSTALFSLTHSLGHNARMFD